MAVALPFAHGSCSFPVGVGLFPLRFGVVRSGVCIGRDAPVAQRTAPPARSVSSATKVNKRDVNTLEFYMHDVRTRTCSPATSLRCSVSRSRAV